MNAKIMVLLILFPLAAQAQGFAGLGATADGFTNPAQGQALTFPADRNSVHCRP